jgi:NAD(P)-dependent dehydrogenase (short-subunit alcohol dehydrogenase family)
MRLENKVALVTGAARGIGAEICRLFAEEGASVILTDMRDAEGRRTADAIGKKAPDSVTVAYRHLDVTDEDGWRLCLEEVIGRHKRLDILVNNAGISRRMPLEEFPVEVWDEMMAVNVKGVFLGMKHAVPYMKNQGGGCIINMASIAGLIGHKTSSIAYIATKGAVTLMTKGMAVQFASDNIRVNSLHPSTVDTPLVKDLFQNPEMKKARLAEVPMGRLATVTDVARAALYLASEEAAFITGVGLPVDGGVTAD